MCHRSLSVACLRSTSPRDGGRNISPNSFKCRKLAQAQSLRMTDDQVNSWQARSTDEYRWPPEWSWTYSSRHRRQLRPPPFIRQLGRTPMLRILIPMPRSRLGRRSVYFTPTSDTLSDLSVPQVVDAVHARSEENGWAEASEPKVIGLLPNGISARH